MRLSIHSFTSVAHCTCAFVVEFLKRCWISKNLSWSLPAHPHLDSHTIVAQVVARMRMFLSIKFVLGPLDEPVACIDGIWADVRLSSAKNTCKDSWIWTAFRGGWLCLLLGRGARQHERRSWALHLGQLTRCRTMRRKAPSE